MATYNKRGYVNKTLNLICIENQLNIFQVYDNGTMEGFIVDKVLEYNLTIGKTYFISNYDYSDKYYSIVDDLGNYDLFPKFLFGKLDDLRNYKLNKLLNLNQL